MARPKEFLDWEVEFFGPIALTRKERLRRFAEEALELLHAECMPLEELDRIMWRVWKQLPGKTLKEIGQAQACLETFAESIGTSADEQASKEFDRVRTIPKEEWQKRHAAKMEVQFCFHKRGERDVFRSFEHLPLPAVDTVIIFGQQTWRVTDVTYVFDHQRIDVIAVRD